MSTATPVRIQRSRKRGSRLVSPNGLPVAVVTRGTRFGNPFRPGHEGPMGRRPIDKAGSLGFFQAMLSDPQLRDAAGYPTDEEIRRQLRGKNLACWCGPRDGCHADELLRIANGPAAHRGSEVADG